MINLNEVFETNKMIHEMNLDVRTITIGISLLDCVGSTLEEVKENIYHKITTVAKDLVKTGKDIEKEFGTPKDIIESYIRSCENEYVLKKMQVAAFLKKTLIFFLILITLISIFELYSIYEIMNQKIIKEEEIVEIYDK